MMSQEAPEMTTAAVATPPPTSNIRAATPSLFKADASSMPSSGTLATIDARNVRQSAKFVLQGAAHVDHAGNLDHAGDIDEIKISRSQSIFPFMNMEEKMCLSDTIRRCSSLPVNGYKSTRMTIVTRRDVETAASSSQQQDHRYELLPESVKVQPGCSTLIPSVAQKR